MHLLDEGFEGLVLLSVLSFSILYVALLPAEVAEATHLQPTTVHHCAASASWGTTPTSATRAELPSLPLVLKRSSRAFHSGLVR